MYKAAMSATQPGAKRSLVWRLAPLVAIVLLALAAYAAVGRGAISLEALVRHRAAIDGFVVAHPCIE